MRQKRLREDGRLDQGTGERGTDGGMRGGRDAGMENFREGGKEERLEGEEEAGMKVREPEGCVLLGGGVAWGWLGEIQEEKRCLLMLRPSVCFL